MATIKNLEVYCGVVNDDDPDELLVWFVDKKYKLEVYDPADKEYLAFHTIEITPDHVLFKSDNIKFGINPNESFTIRVWSVTDEL